jgi:CubicO group peptidase (beta-lactamase class C family)
MTLRDAGALDLDEPLVRLIPEFAAAHNPFGPIEAVTLRRLLRHTSGLQSEPPIDDLRAGTFPTMSELVRRLHRVAVAIPPDSAWKYSNLGYQLLGEVVRRLSGRSYGEYLRETILDPLGMSTTSTDPIPAADRAQGYRRRGANGERALAGDVAADETGGADALWSTVADLAKWISLQFRADDMTPPGSAEVLAGSTIAEMQRAVIVSDPELGAAQGFGWKAARRGGTVVVGHGGFTKGFTSRIDFVPDRRLGVVVLFNGIGDPLQASHLAWSLLERALGLGGRSVGHDVRVTDGPVDDAGRRDLRGTYLDLEYGNAARVEERLDGLVYVEVDDDRRQRLIPTDDPLRFTFSAGRQAGETLVFLTRPDGTVDALHAAGYTMART